MSCVEVWGTTQEMGKFMKWQTSALSNTNSHSILKVTNIVPIPRSIIYVRFYKQNLITFIMNK